MPAAPEPARGTDGAGAPGGSVPPAGVERQRILADLASHPASSAGQIARRLGTGSREVYRILKSAELTGQCQRSRAGPGSPWAWECPAPAPEPAWRYRAASPAPAGLAAEVHAVEMFTARAPYRRLLCGDLAGPLREGLGLTSVACDQCIGLLPAGRGNAGGARD